MYACTLHFIIERTKHCAWFLTIAILYIHIKECNVLIYTYCNIILVLFIYFAIHLRFSIDLEFITKLLQYTVLFMIIFAAFFSYVCELQIYDWFFFI